ncbi:iron complex transport system substrate-binding protein (plasmid) [Ketogulonicigenium robustum]|uniref:Iron complex transport system substrate-binding protein n=1 Tax=Ketogulonicigenium robustum TaxID=92947 RepID=A0A1W6P3N9_9RHOB|nr:ABC transporter substrate-binding protein [Ketogulonicigenium robustum]ARO16001.1 iron complex transport system substrate-binding protein [Ketogulonicigenium robustum]
MKRSIVILAAALPMALPAAAQEVRTVTDHMGFEVVVPDVPQRVVTLNDWTTTVMAHELGANVVGSGGRVGSDGAPYMRSMRELYGVEFGDEIALASIHGELDAERIAALRPDLIIALESDAMPYRAQLASIAPVLMYAAENGQSGLENYADLAEWLGKGAAFDALQAGYEARVQDVRGRMPAAPGSYIAMLPNPREGTIYIYRTYGSMTVVLEDLGFSRDPMMDAVPEGAQSMVSSAELIGGITADSIFMTHIPDRGEDLGVLMGQLDEIAPGYRDFLPAVAAGNVVSLPRFHVYPPTFAAMGQVLDHFDPQ